MKSRMQKAWDKFENFMTCEGAWPLTNSPNSDTAMRLRKTAMKIAFVSGYKFGSNVRKKRVKKY